MPDIWYDVDANLAEVPINIMPLIDDTDFKSKEESVVYNQGGLDLVWNFVTTAGAFTQTAVTPTDTGGAHDWVNQGNGYYTIEIPASSGTINNDTEGFGWFSGFATGILPWRGPTIGFRAAAINNSLVDGATVDVNVTAISGDTNSADNLEAATDGNTYNVGGGAVVAASVTGAVGSVTGAVASVSGNVGGNVVGSIGSLGATAKLDVNAEVDTALNTAIPGTPTADSINERLKSVDDKLPSKNYLTGTANSDGDIEIGDVTGAFPLTVSGTVDTAVNGHTPTASEFQADDITEATADHYKGRVIIWKTGNLAGQATRITAYAKVGTIGQFTVVSMTEAPANNDTFTIV